MTFHLDDKPRATREDISAITGKNFIAALFNFNKPIIWTTTAGYFKDYGLREDATQNVAHKMCRQGESFWRKKFEEQNAAATLVITTKNICLDMIESRKRRFGIPNEVIEIENQNIADISFGAIEENEKFKIAIQILDPIIRNAMDEKAVKIFNLYIRGYSNPEIGEKLGVSSGNVGVIKHRIMKLIEPHKHIITEVV